VEAIISGLLLGTYLAWAFKKKDLILLNSAFELEILSSTSYASIVNKSIKIASIRSFGTCRFTTQ
jgi:hypothetical protein